MSNIQLTHDFIKFIMENYGIKLSMPAKDADIFEKFYPDLVEVLEKENDD